MARTISKADLDRMQKRKGVRVERQAPKNAAQPKPATPPAPAPQAKPDPDIKALLATLTDLAVRNNITLEQLARIAATQNTKPEPRPKVFMLEGIKELRITERDSDGNIKAIRPVREVRH